MKKKQKYIQTNIKEILPNIELFARNQEDYINSLEMAVELLQREVENLRGQLKPHKQKIENKLFPEISNISKSNFLRCRTYEEVFSKYYEIVSKYFSLTDSNIYILYPERKLKPISKEIESHLLNTHLNRLVEEGITDWAIEKKDASIIPNIYNEEGLSNTFFLIVPFYLLDNAIGIFLALTISNGIELPNSAFTEICNEAENAAMAIDNLRSSKEMVIINKKLSALNTQMMETSRLASIGELTTAISMEMSNPLQVIKANLKLLLDGVGNKTRRLDIITKKIDLITELNSRLSKFGETITSEKTRERVNICNIIDELLLISSSQFQRDFIEIETRYEQTEQYLLGAKTQLQQSILNILFFMRDTMPDGGKITIVVSNYKNRYINIVISDNGNGIRKQYVSKVFDPMFSDYRSETKIRKGLFLVKNMVEQHKGNISVYSEIGKGTTFKLSFPSAINVERIL